MAKRLDIHNYPRRVELAVKDALNSNISKRNKDIIMEFREYCSAEGISLARISRYIGVLKNWAEVLDIDFDVATKDDITRGVRILQENERYSPHTKSTYKIMLKRFFRWLKKSGDEQPPETKWISTQIKRTDRRLPANGDMITEDEVKTLVALADHPRDKALVFSLYESGARIGELATLQISNVKFDEYGALIHVSGKTGSRPIRLISSVPYIVTWIQNHPFKENPQAPLWVNFGSTRHHGIMTYASIRITLRRLFLKANIRKRFNPHIFRHSRATFLADHLTEFQMNQFFGWIQGSKMPSTYVHMSGKRIDASILALNGVNQPKEESESQLKPKMCHRCDTINAVDAKYCSKCAGFLDLKSAFELEEKLKEQKQARILSDGLLNHLVKDPEFLRMIQEKVKALGLPT